MCSVYDIIAEKRLGCHLIPGLEIILAEYLKHFLKNGNYDEDVREKLVEIFPKVRANRKKLIKEEIKIEVDENIKENEKAMEQDIPTELMKSTRL